MYNMTAFNAVQCERVAGNHKIEGVLIGRVGVKCEHRQIVSYHINILESVHGMLAQWGRPNEMVEVMPRRKVEICGLRVVR